MKFQIVFSGQSKKKCLLEFVCKLRQKDRFKFKYIKVPTYWRYVLNLPKKQQSQSLGLRLIRRYSFSGKPNSNVLTLLHYNASQLNIRTHHSSSNQYSMPKLNKSSARFRSKIIPLKLWQMSIHHGFRIQKYTAKATFRSHGSSLLLRLPVEPYRGQGRPPVC